MSDDTYYRNELAMRGIDAWITREPDYDDGPPENDDRYPEGCCQDCGEDLAFMGYSGSPEDTYEIYACPKCDLPNPPWTPGPKFDSVEIAGDDEEVPF